MILIHESVEANLKHFLNAIKDNPQTWRLISIEFQDCETLHSQLFNNLCLKNLHHFFNDTECKIFWNKPGYILVFFQGRAMPIEKCVEGFLKEIEFKGFGRFFDILDLSIHWENLNTLLGRIFAPIDATLSTISHQNTPQAMQGFQIELSHERIQHLKASRKARTKPLILLVEDDAFTLQLVKLAFKENFDVITAETVRQALVYYGRHLPDMVFLDIQLPDGNGISLLQQMTAADDSSHIVMLSSHSQKEKIIECMGLGARGFIAKPFTRQRLMDATEKFKSLRARGQKISGENLHGT